jgi:hypothetical protein
MTWLFLNARSIGLLAALAAVLGGVIYVQSLRSTLSHTRLELHDAKQATETYKSAAERAVEDAEALIRSRDAAAADYRSALDRIASARGACLDTRIPPELAD